MLFPLRCVPLPREFCKRLTWHLSSALLRATFAAQAERRRRRLRILLGGLALLVVTAAILSSDRLFPSPEVRRVERLFRSARHRLGSLLDGVSLRFCPDLTVVTVVDQAGAVLGLRLVARALEPPCCVAAIGSCLRRAEPRFTGTAGNPQW